MIGLINSAGAYLTSRLQSSDSPQVTAQTSTEVGEPPMWIKPYRAEAVTAESTRDVDPVEFQNGQAARHAPDGEESDRLNQMELESNLSGGVGAFLDTVA